MQPESSPKDILTSLARLAIDACEREGHEALFGCYMRSVNRWATIVLANRGVG